MISILRNKIKTEKKTIQTVAIIIVPLMAAWICSSFFFRIIIIDGNSMEPSLSDGQVVLINRFDKNYSINDIVVIRSKLLNTVIVKRIVGESGDKIRIEENGVFRNSIMLFSIKEKSSATNNGEQEYVVPQNSFFVLGDNINHSVDSRDERVSFVKKEDIIGKVIVGGS